ncbi:PPK2 family polyphosphate kinase [Methylacidimicrobium sp. B4]|uniref:PPK2 family polyphosphate kinase n=1 Tax=Methylacidimicrobium sp. B4 TaxID=2796139 RepID=UPI001A8DD5F5|nr:PPK2 family polyphosphate kinase [Methylacidimicrobium sp. B4]QSR84600.1 polyphosphate kinase 2 family protein [Methylacidimicrobium sp. B4]
MRASDFAVAGKEANPLRGRDPSDTAGFRSKEEAREKLESDVSKLAERQEVFFAARSFALLVVLQGMDSSGKDSLIRHVLSGLNPQGVEVASFRQPTDEEVAHDYLWRCQRRLPERGRIGIFNRSYYEEVLVVRVHPDLLPTEGMRKRATSPAFWSERYEDILSFERHLFRSSTILVKFFLHLSRREQAKRLLDRIDRPEKRWKFSLADVQERERWPEYERAYEEMLAATSVAHAPWYVLPADHKWVTQLAAASILLERLEELKLRYPEPRSEIEAEASQAKEILKRELDQ